VAGYRKGLHIPLSLTGNVTIGRKRGEVLLEDPLVSGSHCRIEWRQGSFWLVDLGSTNGTLVDGRAVKESLLRTGSEIAVGGSKMILCSGDELATTQEEKSSQHQDIAWLLDEELVEVRPQERSKVDIIGQELRLPPGLVVTLDVASAPGVDQGRNIRFTRGSVTIGRKTGEVALSDSEVSRHHAVIEIFGRDMLFLRDLGSTNGTYHNGRRISVSRLLQGDTIGCGKTVMKVQLGPS
jgi:pSer/pThr/pTyr-binding forkhead associated (FHA) protein